MHTGISFEDREQVIDEEHLRLLSIGYYIAGGLHIAFASFFIIHFVFLIMLTSHPDLFPPTDHSVAISSDAVLHIFTWVLGAIIFLGWLFGGLTIYAGRCIKSRTRRTLSLVMAALNILAIPAGTIVGVCGLIVLSRSSIRRLYMQESL